MQVDFTECDSFDTYSSYERHVSRVERGITGILKNDDLNMEVS